MPCPGDGEREAIASQLEPEVRSSHTGRARVRIEREACVPCTSVTDRLTMGLWWVTVNERRFSSTLSLSLSSLPLSAPDTMTQVAPQQIDHPTTVTHYEFPASHDEFPRSLNDALFEAAKLGRNPLAMTRPPPIWIMRQAGRYLPEFQQVRREHSFFTVCRTPALVAKVTLQPIDRYDGLLDASIIFSDILVVPQAMGIEVQMLGGVGPHLPEPLLGPEDAQRRILDRETDVFDELKYVYAAITETRHQLGGRVPLIGFCAGPWTLFGYMVEGGGSRTWEKAKSWTYKNPDSAKAVLEKIAHVSAEYLAGQVRAGAQVSSLLLPPLFALPRRVALNSR